MSDQTPTPPKEDYSPPIRRSLLRRLVRRLLWPSIFVLVALICIPVALGEYLKTEDFKERLSAALARADIRLKYDRFSLSLWDGLHLTGFRIGGALAPVGTPPWAEAEEVLIDYNLLSLLYGELVIHEIRVVKPSVVLDITDGQLQGLPPAEPEPPRPPRPYQPPTKVKLPRLPFPIRLGKLTVSDIAFAMKLTDKGQSWLDTRAYGISVNVEGRAGPSLTGLKAHVTYASLPGVPNANFYLGGRFPLQFVASIDGDVSAGLIENPDPVILAHPAFHIQAHHVQPGRTMAQELALDFSGDVDLPLEIDSIRVKDFHLDIADGALGLMTTGGLRWSPSPITFDFDLINIAGDVATSLAIADAWIPPMEGHGRFSIGPVSLRGPLEDMLFEDVPTADADRRGLGISVEGLDLIRHLITADQADMEIALKSFRLKRFHPYEADGAISFHARNAQVAGFNADTLKLDGIFNQRPEGTDGAGLDLRLETGWPSSTRLVKIFPRLKTASLTAKGAIHTKEGKLWVTEGRLDTAPLTATTKLDMVKWTKENLHIEADFLAHLEPLLAAAPEPLQSKIASQLDINGDLNAHVVLDRARGGAFSMDLDATADAPFARLIRSRTDLEGAHIKLSANGDLPGKKAERPLGLKLALDARRMMQAVGAGEGAEVHTQEDVRLDASGDLRLSAKALEGLRIHLDAPLAEVHGDLWLGWKPFLMQGELSADVPEIATLIPFLPPKVRDKAMEWHPQGQLKARAESRIEGKQWRMEGRASLADVQIENTTRAWMLEGLSGTMPFTLSRSRMEFQPELKALRLLMPKQKVPPQENIEAGGRIVLDLPEKSYQGSRLRLALPSANATVTGEFMHQSGRQTRANAEVMLSAPYWTALWGDFEYEGQWAVQTSFERPAGQPGRLMIRQRDSKADLRKPDKLWIEGLTARAFEAEWQVGRVEGAEVAGVQLDGIENFFALSSEPVAPVPGGLRIERLRWQSANQPEPFELGPVQLDVSHQRDRLWLQPAHIRLLGGNALGGARLTTRGTPRELDIALDFSDVVTSQLLNLDEEESAINGDTRLHWSLGEPWPEGTMNLTRIGPKTLEKILDYLDPQRTNPSFNNYRNLLRIAGLRPKQVPVVLREGILLLDVQWENAGLVGTVLYGYLGSGLQRPVEIPLARLVERIRAAKKAQAAAPTSVPLRP